MNLAAQELGRLGGRASSDKLTPAERSDRARAAAAKRWASATDADRQAAASKMAAARAKKRKRT